MGAAWGPQSVHKHPQIIKVDFSWLAMMGQPVPCNVSCTRDVHACSVYAHADMCGVVHACFVCTHTDMCARVCAFASFGYNS